uniref:Uncharacterized protein n=1 Tax=Setaria viridis TaxID=4556 RepID=A0A4U6W728_SETVI|nr:hypothetical protein SEVIR_1G061566v2 [Setaria viridis]
MEAMTITSLRSSVPSMGGKEDEGFSGALFATCDLWIVNYLDVAPTNLRCCIYCLFAIRDFGMIDWLISNVSIDDFSCYKRCFEML